MLRKVLGDARAHGLEPVFGHELEFYVYRAYLSGQDYTPIYGPQSWFSVHALGMAQRFVDQLDHAAAVMGLPVVEIFSEHGAGQFEINLEPCHGVLAARTGKRHEKIAIKEIAQSLGMRATFLARHVPPPDHAAERLSPAPVPARRARGQRAPALDGRRTGCRAPRGTTSRASLRTLRA